MPPLGWRKNHATADTTSTTPNPPTKRKCTTEPNPRSKKHKLQTKKPPLLPPPLHHPHFTSAAKPAIENITIIVGAAPDDQTFTVSADLISKRSQYLRPIIDRLRGTGITAPIMLPSIRPELFNGYVEWCKQSVSAGGWDIRPITRALVDARMKDGEGKVKERVEVVVKRLASFWLLGEFLHDAAFQNAAMRQLLRQSRQVAMEDVDVALEVSGLVGPLPLPLAPPAAGEERAGEDSGVKWEGNALQRWAIDLLAAVLTKRHVEEMQWAWSKEFLVALFVRTLEIPAGGRMDMVPMLEGGKGEGFMVRER